MYNPLMVRKIIQTALIEDLNQGDSTTDFLIKEDHISYGEIFAKQDGMVAGTLVVQDVFKMLDPQIQCHIIKKDSEKVKKGQVIMTVSGKTKNILKGERVALNFLQRMSGIASLAYEYYTRTKDYPVRVVDTRKTTPGLRCLEKYAVRMGGCKNHRYNLSDAVMIKDNHIQAVGSITKAVKKVRENIPHTMKIEVEVKNLEELQEALEVSADIIMLDNMDIITMKKAVELVEKKAILEASGNVTLDRLKEIAQVGVDVISVGALTHSAPSMDISFLIKEVKR